MKHYLPFIAVALIFVACNKNNPDTPKQGGDETNQPAYPSIWSPVGKKYVCDRSGDNPYDLPYYVEVIHFFSNDSAISYGTTNRDLSPINGSDNSAIYKYTCRYPDLTLKYGIEERPLYFIDTLSLRSDYWELTYTLY